MAQMIDTEGEPLPDNSFDLGLNYYKEAYFSINIPMWFAAHADEEIGNNVTGVDHYCSGGVLEVDLKSVLDECLTNCDNDELSKLSMILEEYSVKFRSL